MDVTKEIRRNHVLYGASDNTAYHRTAAGRSLNYAAGPSITRPDKINVTSIPRVLKFDSSVGLFGAENYFVKVNLDIQDSISGACFEERFWECARISKTQSSDDELYYKKAIIDDSYYPTINTYEQAEITKNYLPYIGTKMYIDVNLNNLKTGNIYVDDWLDVRLYTSDRQEHPYEKMYVPIKGSFYIGIHARNTRRLPFNIECLIGTEYRSFESIEDKRYVMNLISIGPHY